MTQRDQGLVRGMGALGLAAAVFNTVVGAGIFVIPASLARDVGPAAPLAYLACVAAMGAVSLCFAAAGSRVPTSGGPYGYAEAAFGPLTGFVVGVLVWLGAVLAAAGIAAAVVDSLAQFAPVLGQPGLRAALLLAIFATLASINVAGVTPGTRLVGVLTIAKLAPLLLLLLVAAPHLHAANLAFGAPPPRALGRAMILALFAFQGMETALGVSGEVKDPARNVPRGLLAAMGSVAVLYMAIQASAQGVLGPALAHTRTPLVDTMRAVAPPLTGVIMLGAAVSMLGYLASDTLSAPRVLFAFARDGFLPKRVAALHPRSHAPYVAILLHASIAFVLAVSGSFVELAVLSSLATVMVYIVGCAAAVRLQRSGAARAGPPLRVRGLSLAAAIGVLSMAWIAANAALAEALGCLAAIVIAIGWYAVAARGRSQA
jgi:amino acid transporter